MTTILHTYVVDGFKLMLFFCFQSGNVAKDLNKNENSLQKLQKKKNKEKSKTGIYPEIPCADAKDFLIFHYRSHYQNIRFVQL